MRVPDKFAGQGGSAVIIAIAVIVVVAIVAVVFVVASNDGDQSKEPEVAPSATANAELPASPALEQLQAAISDPNLPWSEKKDAWDYFLRETEPTPLECQQLPPNDRSLLAALESELDRRSDYSPDVRAFLEEMVAILTEYWVPEIEWDTPEPTDQQVAQLVDYLDRMAKLWVEYGAETSSNDDGLYLCFYSRP